MQQPIRAKNNILHQRKLDGKVYYFHEHKNMVLQISAKKSKYDLTSDKILINFLFKFVDNVP